MESLLHMGGYGAFVWPAYAASLFALGGAIALTWSAHARMRRMVERLESGKRR
ncbi:MAG: heme exporter protein CcmD [Alphaproteobacteria bacterium]